MSDIQTEIKTLRNSKSEDDRKKCILLLERYLSLHPNDCEAWYDLAGCHDFIGDEVGAEKFYRKVWEMGVDQLPAAERASYFVGFGSTLRNNLQFSQSSEVLKKGTQDFSKYPALDIFLAFSLYSEGKYKEAAEVLFRGVTKIEAPVFDGYEKAIRWYVDNLGSHPVRPLPNVIVTDRLVLRPIQDEDLESIFSYCSDPNVSKHTTWEAHSSLEDSKKLISYAKANYQRGLSEPLAIAFKEDPTKMIGTVGWFWSSERYKAIELAYALSPLYWGRGIVVEACRGLIDEALRNHEILRITSRCMVENTASARVMEKLGMEYEGTQKQLMKVKGRWVDLKNYCILTKDWK